MLLRYPELTGIVFSDNVIDIDSGADTHHHTNLRNIPAKSPQIGFIASPHKTQVFTPLQMVRHNYNGVLDRGGRKGASIFNPPLFSCYMPDFRSEAR
jgi:hypothetical protein